MDKKNWLKFVIGWVVVFAVRLFPFRPPNVEPVLATLMPFSKRFGYWSSFLFGFLSIGLFDLATGKLGQWTLLTGITYGLVGVGAAYFFRKRNATALSFAAYGFIGTIAYDAVTGLSMGPLFFGQSLSDAFFGQIPFTLAHLAGTLVLAVLVSPALYRWVVENKRLETTSVFRFRGAEA
ncbi:MAG TPA: hypothetical protein VMC43_00530 [Candidatus Paceibacterota bacterium]|nr:hypothetical protein [Candidatus Paceibacterota bacterium]